MLKLRLIMPQLLVFVKTEGTAMPEITGLRPTRGRGQRVNIYLDGKFAFSVGSGVASKEGLQPDQELTDERIKALANEDQFERCLAAATRYLAIRPRSQAELEGRLQRRGFDIETRKAVMSRLEDRGLMDDVAFARFWAESRLASSPRSRLLTRIELQKKGVSRDAIDEAVVTIDDAESAYRAAVGRLRSLKQSNREEFHRRLGAYLQRRGFSHGVVEQTVKALWKLRESAEADSRSLDIENRDELEWPRP